MVRQGSLTLRATEPARIGPKSGRNRPHMKWGVASRVVVIEVEDTELSVRSMRLSSSGGAAKA